MRVWRALVLFPSWGSPRPDCGRPPFSCWTEVSGKPRRKLTTHNQSPFFKGLRNQIKRRCILAFFTQGSRGPRGPRTESLRSLRGQRSQIKQIKAKIKRPYWSKTNCCKGAFLQVNIIFLEVWEFDVFVKNVNVLNRWTFTPSRENSNVCFLSQVSNA